MECTYNESTRKFKLIYFDALKAARGDKYPYGRKQTSWKGKKKPTKKEIEIEIKKLLNEGKILEEAKQIEADKLNNELFVTSDANNDTQQVNAVKYLLQVDAKTLATKAKTKNMLRKVERILIGFAEFLKKNYPLIALDEINRKHITEFFATLQNHCGITQKNHYMYLRKLWDKIIIEFENTPIKYINHFRRIEMGEIVTRTPMQDKLAFTVEQIKHILNFAANTQDCCQNEAEQKFAIFYFLTVTGWRISDILGLTWEQVNLEQRTITTVHGKTENSTGHETIIYITPLMMDVLKRMQKNAEQHPFNTEFVFNYRRSTKKITAPEHYAPSINKLLFAALEKLGILKSKENKFGIELKNYTLHCFRKSVITELGLAEIYAPNRITYLVGHADNSIEAKHYMKLKMYPERSTRTMLEHMENITDLRYYWNTITKSKHEASKQEFASNDWLSDAKINDLMLNFWDADAVKALHDAWSHGTNRMLLDAVIYTCDNVRKEQGHAAVTADIVKDVLQMLQWFNASQTLEKQLNA